MSPRSWDNTATMPQGVLRGVAQIRMMIQGIIAEFTAPGVSFDLLSEAAEGPVATFVWTAETARNRYDLGSETYVLRDGKISHQTFAAKVVAK